MLLLRATAVVAIGAAIALAVALWPSSGPAPSAHDKAAGAAARKQQATGPVRIGPVSAAGLLVMVEPSGHLAVSAPDGAGLKSFDSLGIYHQQPPAVSGDNRFAVTPSGQVLALSGGQVSFQGPGVGPALSQQTVVDNSDAFADGDRAVIVLTEGRFGVRTAEAEVSAAIPATGKVVSLGTANLAAGDPQAVGAFVSVAVPGPFPASGSHPVQPDSRVELRDAGKPAVVLGTAPQLLADIGDSTSEKAALSVSPSPSGNEVAVAIFPDSTGNQNTGIVVLNRNGKVLGTTGGGLGPSLTSGGPVWSPNGQSLAYVTAGSRGADLEIWTVGGASLGQALADQAPVSDCLWSPDGSAVLCSGYEASSGAGGTTAFIVRSRGGPLTVTKLAGAPLAWVSGGRG